MPWKERDWAQIIVSSDSCSAVKVEAAIVIPRKNYGFVTFSSIAPVEQLLEMREPLEIAGSEVFLRQVNILKK